MEILAPVGDINMLYAAVSSGANAVYLGLEKMNARQSANNFTPYALKEAVAFCHARNVKVYVTLNTLITPSQLGLITLMLKQIANSNADAIIVQDLAAAVLIKKIIPSIDLHGSTQMSVHSVQGAKQLEKLGFSRVILSRELSLDSIAEINKNCNIETEVFVHGALCMSVSGQCYMSAFFGGRSGNKGTCAGPCRLPFESDTAIDKRACEHHLSLKDMSHINMLNELKKAGVSCVKIEGRLRTPEYVAACVNACLCTLSGNDYDADLLKDVFSRSGFTDGYINGKLNENMFGIRTADDSVADRKALPKLRELFRRERANVAVEMKWQADINNAFLTVSDNAGNSYTVESSVTPELAQSDRSEHIKKALLKTGGTPFFVSENIEISGEIFICPPLK